MATIKEWPEGYLLSMDPRREDPLFYYMRGDDWERAIGLDIIMPEPDRLSPDVFIAGRDDVPPDIRDAPFDRRGNTIGL